MPIPLVDPMPVVDPITHIDPAYPIPIRYIRLCRRSIELY